MFTLNFKELCDFFGNSESTVKQKFKRKQEEYARKGIDITKNGRGASATYDLNLNANWIGEVPTTTAEAKQNLSMLAETHEICYGCKKYIVDSPNRIFVPSASGKSEILAYCCDECLEEYHFYL